MQTTITETKPRVIRIVVPGAPMAQPRQRTRVVQVKNGKSFAQNYTPAKDPVQGYKAAVKMAAWEAYQGEPLRGPVRCDVLWLFPRPKNIIWKTKPMPRLPHTSKPDRDNLDKAVMDSLSGLVWVDDCQAFCGTLEKWIAAGDEQPRVEITVTEVLI